MKMHKYAIIVRCINLDNMEIFKRFKSTKSTRETDSFQSEEKNLQQIKHLALTQINALLQTLPQAETEDIANTSKLLKELEFCARLDESSPSYILIQELLLTISNRISELKIRYREAEVSEEEIQNYFKQTQDTIGVIRNFVKGAGYLEHGKRYVEQIMLSIHNSMKTL